MRMQHTRGLIIILFITVFCAKARAQDKQPDTTTDRVSANMVDYFNKSVGRSSRIYNGQIFSQYKFVSKTNANFKDSANFNNGWVRYEGNLYHDVPLIYDIDRDVVVCQLYNKFSKYTLAPDLVSEFGLLGHHFIRLVPDEKNKHMLTGYYDELYSSKLQVLARRSKTVREELVGQFMQSYFLPKTDYYLKFQGKYYDVGSQGSLLSVLKDKKKELEKYLKDNSIRYKDDPEQTMVLLAAYYDHITN